MIESFLVGLSYCAVLALNLYEKKQYGTWLNPYTLLSVPFTFICLICILFNHVFGFITFHVQCLYVWIFGLILFWLGGVGVRLIFANTKLQFKKYEYKQYNLATIILILLVAFGLAYTSLKLRSLGIDSVGSKETGEEISQGGIAGRISNLLLLSIPFFVFFKAPKMVKFPLVGLLMFFIVSLGSKTWLTYSIIACFYLYSLSGKTLNKKLLIYLPITLYAAFYLYYKLLLNFDEEKALFNYVLRHFYFYLTSGALPYSEILVNDIPVNSEGVSHPIVVLIRTWFGERISYHSSLWIPTDTVIGTRSNVYTFFGTLWIMGSSFDFIFYSLFSGIICYFIFLCSRRSDSIFIQIAWAYTIAILFFGWYNWGIGLLRIWEIYIYSFIFWVLSKYHLSKLSIKDI